VPNVDIFTRFGLFVRRGFLDPEGCLQIRREMASADRARAHVRRLGEASGAVDEMVRRTDAVELSAATTVDIERRLLSLMPELDAHFGVRLTGCQGPQFYIYEEGDFFLPHQDRGSDTVAPDRHRVRQVSVTVFLNDETGGLDGTLYRGGALVFYGQRADSGPRTFGLPLQGEEGLFVGFRSDWVHEVRPVAKGTRYSLVTWFF
jgi:predicted 2-oxoglutarate/Fe(II)-dependent dioxygenase YbiX